jgi:hypothetical protein
VSGVHVQGGVFFNDEVMGVLKVIVRAMFPFIAYFNVGNGGMSASGSSMIH